MPNLHRIGGIVRLVSALSRVRREGNLSGSALQDLRERKLRSLLPFVFDRSPFYARHWRKAGIERRHLKTISLEHLPPVNKKLLTENIQDVFTDRSLSLPSLRTYLDRKDNLTELYRGTHAVVHTSGTSGSFGIFTYDPAGWAYIRSILVRHVTRTPINLRKKTRVAFFGAIDGHYPGITLVHHMPAFLYETFPCSVSTSLDTIIPQLEAFDPHQLTGYAWSVWVLARAQLEGRLHVRPARIICSGEPLLPRHREDIRRAFGVEPVNYYACGESLGLGVDDNGEGFHMFDEAHTVEVVRDDGAPAQAGEEGTAVLTSLYNRCEPLIRYEMRDRLVRGEAEGGRSRIRQVQGREAELVWFPTGHGTVDYIHPSTLVEFFVPGVRKFQFQSFRDRLVFQGVFDGEEGRTRTIVEEKLRDILREKDMHNTVTIAVKDVPHLLPDAVTGKFRTIQIMETCKEI